MEDFGSFWTFQENVDELKQKLQYVTYELEITRKQTNEDIMKSNEHIKKLLMTLQNACKERDEAKSQLKNLQQMLSFNNKTVNCDHLIATPFSPDSPLITNFPANTNSGLTESNSFSLETNNTTPIRVSTPDSNNNCFINATTNDTLPPLMMPKEKAIDGATLMIESLAKGRRRPQQGKLLQAVLEAGPLLETLMVAGSLPQWRNPPGSMTRQIPPVQLTGYNKKQVVNAPSNLPFYGQISGGSMGINPNSMLDFGGSSSGSCLVGGGIMPSAVGFDCPTPKRHRLL